MSIKIIKSEKLEHHPHEQQQQQQHDTTNRRMLIERLDLFNSKYYCKICRQKLRTKADEIIHCHYKHRPSSSSSSSTIKQCLQCTSKFNTYYSLRKHLMSKHLNEKPYSCKLCGNGKKFAQFLYLKIHQRKYHAFEKIENLISYSNSVQEEHETEVEKTTPTMIPICSIITVNMKLNCLKCKLCSKVCLTEANYLVHKWEHLINNNKNYLIICWLCKTLKFDTYYDLELHLQTKHYINEYPYECGGECKHLSYDWNLTKLHLTKMHHHHSMTTVRFKCSFCQQIFFTHKDIVFHTLRTHSSSSSSNQQNDYYSYKCGLCEDKFKSKITLNLHLKQHEFIAPTVTTKQEPRTPPPPAAAVAAVTTIDKRRSSSSLNSSLLCQQCGYTFENTFFLNQHKSLHFSDNLKRPHKCHLCQVTFSKAEQLFRHMIVHQATALDHVCKICYSTFSRKQDLDRHMNFHSK